MTRLPVVVTPEYSKPSTHSCCNLLVKEVSTVSLPVASITSLKFKELYTTLASGLEGDCSFSGPTIHVNEERLRLPIKFDYKCAQKTT